MILLTIITYKNDFSNQIIQYFKSLNNQNEHQLLFYPIGMDMKNDETIINDFFDYLEKNTKIKLVLIFSDMGLPTKLAKMIEFKYKNSKMENIKLFRSNGSLIENGYLTYILSNTNAPWESISEILEKNLDKNN